MIIFFKIKALDKLNLKEKKEAINITEEKYIFHLKKDIDCVGCCIQIKSFIKDISNAASLKNSPINLEGIIFYQNKTMGFLNFLFDLIINI